MSKPSMCPACGERDLAVPGTQGAALTVCPGCDEVAFVVGEFFAVRVDQSKLPPEGLETIRLLKQAAQAQP